MISTLNPLGIQSGGRGDLFVCRKHLQRCPETMLVLACPGCGQHKVDKTHERGTSHLQLSSPPRAFWGVFPFFSLVTILITNSWKKNKIYLKKHTYEKTNSTASIKEYLWAKLFRITTGFAINSFQFLTEQWQIWQSGLTLTTLGVLPHLKTALEPISKTFVLFFFFFLSWITGLHSGGSVANHLTGNRRENSQWVYVSSFKLIHCSQHGDGKIIQNLSLSCPLVTWKIKSLSLS